MFAAPCCRTDRVASFAEAIAVDDAPAGQPSGLHPLPRHCPSQRTTFFLLTARSSQTAPDRRSQQARLASSARATCPCHREWTWRGAMSPFRGLGAGRGFRDRDRPPSRGTPEQEPGRGCLGYGHALSVFTASERRHLRRWYDFNSRRSCQRFRFRQPSCCVSRRRTCRLGCEGVSLAARNSESHGRKCQADPLTLTTLAASIVMRRSMLVLGATGTLQSGRRRSIRFSD
jgi:hypothetical protein